MIYEFNGIRPRIDESAYVSESATIIGSVEIGRECYVGPRAVLRGDGAGNRIVIGDGSVVEDGVIIHNSVSVGENVTIGHGAVVHCRLLRAHAGVGMGAILSIGAEIGEYSVVAEGAVVRQGQVVPDRVVAGGVPAKILRAVESRDTEWWERANSWYRGLVRLYRDPEKFKRLL